MLEVNNTPVHNPSRVSNDSTDTFPTIFFIEEDDDARPNFRRMFRKLGYRVLIAANLEDALEWVANSHIPADGVIVDLLRKSPEEALEIGRELRKHAKYNGHTPLIVLPEKIPAELEGRDERVGENDWVCYYEDGEQIQALVSRLLPKSSLISTAVLIPRAA